MSKKPKAEEPAQELAAELATPQADEPVERYLTEVEMLRMDLLNAQAKIAAEQALNGG